MKWLLMLVMLIVPVSGWGAKCTTTASGSWSDNTKWGAPCNGSGVPGSGAFTNYSGAIASGHSINLDDNRNIYGAQIKGTLTIKTGATVTSSSHITISNSGGSGSLVHESGSTLDLSGGPYNISNNDASGGACSWIMTGTPASRAILIGGTGRIISPQATGGTNTSWSYAKISGFTGASGNVIQGHTSLSISNTLFYGMAGLTIGSLSMPATAPFTFTNNDIRAISPSVSNNLIYFQKVNALSTNTRTISGNTFVGNGTSYTDQTIAWRGIQGFSLNDNVFYNVRVQSVSQFHSNTWDGNIVWADSAQAAWKDQVSLYIGRGNSTWQNGVAASTVNNWHGLQVSNASEDSGMTYIQDSVFDGSWINPNSPDNVILCSASNDATIQRNIFIGAHSGVLPAASSTTNNYIKNNTFANFNPGGGTTATKFHAMLCEFATRVSGSFEFSSNLVYNNGDNTDNVAIGGSGGSDLTSADYNAFYNFTADNKYSNTTGTFGANDIAGSLDPQFKFGTRTIASYAVANGKATITDYFTEAAKRNGIDVSGSDATFNSVFTATGLLSYLREGYTPQNSALKSAGEGGVDIGAVSVIVSSANPSTASKYNLNFGFNF